MSIGKSCAIRAIRARMELLVSTRSEDIVVTASLDMKVIFYTNFFNLI